MKLELDADELDVSEVEERARRLFNVSVKSPDHLKRWLAATDRRWLVFDALALVDSLPWPAGLDMLIQVIACYRDHRRTLPSGRYELQKDPTLDQEVRIPIMRDEFLEIEEMTVVIRFLINKITERDPTWTLEKLAQ